ncbi:repressor [Streptococcus phage Javan249]|nr:repressor [Streptococcus phage Javan249]
MGKSSLSQYISGYSTPDQNKLLLLAKTLDVSESWLMGYDIPMNNEKQDDQIIETPQYKMIQRKAKSLSVSDQERLLQLMDLTFQDVLNGGGDNEHDI